MQFAGGSKLNPVTAGGDGQPCQLAIAGLPNVGEAFSLNALITARTAYAAVDPKGQTPHLSNPVAAAGIEAAEVILGGPFLGVSSATSSISAACVAGVPQYTPASQVATITLAGTPIVLDGAVQPITDALSEAVGALVEVRLNEVVDLPNGGKAVRAARVTLIRGEAPFAEVILAESKLGMNGNACQPPSSGTPPPALPPSVCPPGSVYDVSHNVCVIPAPGSQTPGNPVGDITGPGSVVVGPPYTGPSGGTVMTLPQARRLFGRSACVKRKPGPLYVVLGTKGRDRITGTNRRDRILGLGGTDRIDGGRGRDCIQGGRAKDFITGGQGRDRMYGGRARDIVNGDGKTDRLFGGRGNDTINAGYGADRVRGGRGNDKINVATAGRKATVFAGRGKRDKVRCNPRELKRMHGAEIIKVTRAYKGLNKRRRPR